MTLVELRKKYNFTENITDRNLKDLLLFVMVLMLEIGMHKKGEKTKLEEFIDDIKDCVNK